MIRKAVLTVFGVLILAALAVNFVIAVDHAVGNSSPLSYWDLGLLTTLPAGFITGLLTLRRRFSFSGSTLLIPLWAGLGAIVPSIVLCGVFHIPMLPAVAVNLIVGALCGWVLAEDAVKKSSPPSA